MSEKGKCVPTVVLLTGSGGDAQGWGNMDVTLEVKKAVESNCILATSFKEWVIRRR